MVDLFWDASALAKRYAAEIGSGVVDRLFHGLPARRMITTVWGYAETYSILLRRRNTGRLDPATYRAAVTSLQAEVIQAPEFRFLLVTERAVITGLSLMERHNLNATDATLLSVLLRYVASSGPNVLPCVLISADHRMLRAAGEEGLPTFNPETAGDSDIQAILAAS